MITRKCVQQLYQEFTSPVKFFMSEFAIAFLYKEDKCYTALMRICK